MHRSDHAPGERLERLAIFLGSPDDLVVDVSDVAHIGQFVATLAQPARNDIECHHDACMTNMTEVINGHAADVHAHLICDQRLERLLGFGQRVVNRQRHYWPPQESRSVTVRLNTIASGRRSLRSTQK